MVFGRPKEAIRRGATPARLGLTFGAGRQIAVTHSPHLQPRHGHHCPDSLLSQGDNRRGNVV
jgi:hypothetical protein